MGPQDWGVVQRSQLFQMLPNSAPGALIGEEEPMMIEKGATLCRQGEPATSGFLIIEGVVKLSREGRDACEAVLAIHGPGRALFVGEALANTVLPASAAAVTRARVLAIDGSRMRGALVTDSKLARAMLAAAAQNLRQLVDHIEELKTKTAPARLADFILGLGARAGSEEFSLPYEKQLIADRLGMTPVSLSRALAQLGKHGVRVRRDRILIQDVAALRAFAS